MTKYRRGVLTGEHLDTLREAFTNVCADFGADFGADLVELDGQDNHIYLLVAYPPQVAVALLVNSLEGVSARRPSQRYRIRTYRQHPVVARTSPRRPLAPPSRRSRPTSASSAPGPAELTPP